LQRFRLSRLLRLRLLALRMWRMLSREKRHRSSLARAVERRTFARQTRKHAEKSQA
jgi:hypothetical protein